MDENISSDLIKQLHSSTYKDDEWRRFAHETFRQMLSGVDDPIKIIHEAFPEITRQITGKLLF